MTLVITATAQVFLMTNFVHILHCFRDTETNLSKLANCYTLYLTARWVWASQNFGTRFISKKTRMIDDCHFSRFVTILSVTDRQTDRWTTAVKLEIYTYLSLLWYISSYVSLAWQTMSLEKELSTNIVTSKILLTTTYGITAVPHTHTSPRTLSRP